MACVPSFMPLLTICIVIVQLIHGHMAGLEHICTTWFTSGLCWKYCSTFSSVYLWSFV